MKTIDMGPVLRKSDFVEYEQQSADQYAHPRCLISALESI